MMSQRHAEYNAEVSKEERAEEFKRLKAENETLLNKAKELEAELDAIKCRNIIQHIESICGVCGSIKAEAGCPSCMSDELDLMRDEFARIKALNSNSEVNALCERAVTKITQNVSVIQQRDEAEEKLKSLQSSHNEAVKAVEWINENAEELLSGLTLSNYAAEKLRTILNTKTKGQL
jgi:hypothetical protein